MSMTRKNYVAIAAILAQRIYPVVTAADQSYNYALDDVALKLSIVFNVDNSNFDRQRFLAACVAPCGI